MTKVPFHRAILTKKSIACCAQVIANTPYSLSSTAQELTTVRYPNESKRGDFSVLDPSDVTFFTNLLGKNRVLVDSSELEGFNRDFWNSVKGASQLLLRPKTTQDVSRILAYCTERKLAICPQGGNTGVSGGANPVNDEIILSMSLMNQIESLDEWSGVLVCQPGCILEGLNEFLQEKDLIMPLDLGAKESCQIGGNVSTNAGGLRFLRYGSLHSNILGVEAVLADGTIMDCMSTMKKDNTGYDLKHLFIGSEGTLGVVTKIAIQCPVKPKATNLAFLGLKDYPSVLKTFKRAKKDLEEILSACEYIDNESITAGIENLQLKIPIERFPFYMMIETSGSNAEHDAEKVSQFLEQAMTEGLVQDGTTTSQPSHIKSLWQVRERLPDALLKDGHFYCTDFSIPVEDFDQLVIDTRNYMGSDIKRVTGFGHLGDSNIHLNITAESYNSDVAAKLDHFIYNWVGDKKGSVSAEHGLGFRKKKYLPLSKSPQSIKMMRQIKRLFDPNNILNPYKVLPDQQQNAD